ERWRLLLMLWRIVPSKIGVIPPPWVVPVAGQVMILLLWLPVVVDVCSISLRHIRGSRMLQRRTCICIVVTGRTNST
ncbi:hypothetical protein VIGAN_10111900, partial [Vigna angularis var. angularis]